jgi:hypothetical protein
VQAVARETLSLREHRRRQEALLGDPNRGPPISRCLVVRQARGLADNSAFRSFRKAGRISVSATSFDRRRGKDRAQPGRCLSSHRSIKFAGISPGASVRRRTNASARSASKRAMSSVRNDCGRHLARRDAIWSATLSGISVPSDSMSASSPLTTR